jgi:uncharacterized membrane protein YesL
MRAAGPIKVADISLDEATYVRVTVVQIWDEMAVLLCGSLLVALSVVPTVLLIWWTGYGPWPAIGLFTLAPAWVACCFMIGRATIYGRASLNDFVAAFLQYFWRSCLLALPIIVLLVMVSVGLPALTEAPPFLCTVGIVFQLLALFILVTVFSFAVPILSIFQVTLFQAWSFGLVLVLRNPLVALGLIAMAILLVTAANALGLGIWLIIPLIIIPFEVNATLMLVRKTIELELTPGSPTT